MRVSISLSTVFITTSGFVLMLGSYLLATRTSLSPQFFITACGEALKNINEHVHFNPNGIVSTLVLLTASTSVSLTLLQLIRFLFAHERLQQVETINNVSGNLRWVMNKHRLKSNNVAVVNDGKLTAYTIGLLKPKIIISYSLIQKCTREQLEAIILHELYHLRSRHVLWQLFSRLISSLFFFIPLIEYLAQQLKTEFELAADAFVVKKQKTKKHLCDSLALNLQYAGGVIPHFATSPIERRVESLVGNNPSFERMDVKTLIVSILSLVLMLGIAFTQPSQVDAGLALEKAEVCSVEENCQVRDCTDQRYRNNHNFTPAVPASFYPNFLIDKI